ncbi:hypothetical protein B0H17DRAFT_1007020 [Mycena rosella]|uniref:Uncharacterized protein n=1 Tax=Mycena rosella TaxID=1033263 RepID=A0AAD7GJ84_MYCRO|nr:hypothetical protein B0H17DRAFT_1007020 [Mycena rosella]
MRSVPCTALDLWSPGSIITNGFIIDARLDPKILEQSLWTLVENKFPRAGARLARRNGVYEFQIPRTFDAETPPIAFTVEDHPEPYRSATRPELPTNLLDSQGHIQPSIHPMPGLEVYFRSRKCPTSLDGFLIPNTPLLHVHIAVFDDFTFIGLTFSHILLDGLGFWTLTYAWTRVLSGDAMDTIPGMAWDAAPFEAFTQPTAVTTLRGWFEPPRSSQLQRVVDSLMRLLWSPKKATPNAMRMVRVPKVFLDQSKREINNNLALQGSKEWVASNDVLMAWWFKTVYGLRSIDEAIPVHIHVHVDLRDRLFPGSSTLTTPYIHNATWTIPILVPANAFRTESLAELALRIRRAIKTYNADLDGIATDLRWICSNPGKKLVPFSPGTEFTVQSNVLKGRFGEMDFSGACEGKARVFFAMPEASVVGGNGMTGLVFLEDENSVWMRQGARVKDWENCRQSGTITFV